MSESSHFLPQAERLLRGIAAAESPLIQLWGWPGSGKMAVLQEILVRCGSHALALPLASVASEAALREALEAAYDLGVKWLVATGGPAGDRLAEAERWLRPGQRLIFAADRRSPGALRRGLISPQDLLLTDRELAALWADLTGGGLSPDDAHSLLEATDGWYCPLRLAIEASGGAGLESADAEDLLVIPAVRLFLRHEVVDALPEPERNLLYEAPEERPSRGGEGEESWRLLDSLGLWVEGPERDRMPRLLTAFLDRERRRRRPSGTAVSAVAPQPPEPAGRPAAVRPAYVLCLLGSPVARQRDESGEHDLDCRLRRSFQVLAYLASSPEMEAGREELIEAIWPIEGERTIERNFHPTLSHLRRALESGRKFKDRPAPLLFRNGVYRLNPEVEWDVDVRELARLADEGKDRYERGELEGAAEAWQRAWKLYRGPFLQGYYEGWVTARRETWQRVYLELLRDLGDVYLRLGRGGEAMDAYRTVLIEDQLQEKIHLAVMKLYAQQGRRDLVRRQYDRLCNLLLEELGLSPMPDTTKEYHRLMA